MKRFAGILVVAFLVLVMALPLSCAKEEKKETAKDEKTEETVSKKAEEAESEEEATEFTVTSSAFDNDADIPAKYAHSSAGGQNVSIPLKWENAPEGTESFAIAMVDKNPAANNFLHWLVLNIPLDTTSIAEGASSSSMPADATEFKNNYGEDGYGGPAPPPGEPHDYEITVYALSIPSMSMTENAGLSEFESFTKDKVLGKATVSGKFSQ